jgi:hypothetical protein
VLLHRAQPLLQRVYRCRHQLHSFVIVRVLIGEDFIYRCANRTGAATLTPAMAMFLSSDFHFMD